MKSAWSFLGLYFRDKQLFLLIGEYTQSVGEEMSGSLHLYGSLTIQLIFHKLYS